MEGKRGSGCLLKSVSNIDFNPMMSQQIVLPIKDSNVLKMVQDTLLDSFRAGRRNYTIFQVGKATLLRVSDVMTLKKSDVYNPDGSVKHTAFIHDKIKCNTKVRQN